LLAHVRAGLITPALEQVDRQVAQRAVGAALGGRGARRLLRRRRRGRRTAAQQRLEAAAEASALAHGLVWVIAGGGSAELAGDCSVCGATPARRLISPASAR